MRLPLLPLLLSAAALLPAQDPALKESLAAAKVLWAQQGDREGATARFEQILGALAPKAAELSPEWLRVLCEAHAWSAILEDRVPAHRPLAQKHLEQLLDLDPGFEIDRAVTNARLQAAFDTLRSTRLAKVTLSLAPETGTLELDGRPLASPVGVRHLKPGSHTFTYRRPGYRTATQTLELQARDVKPLSLSLERVASTVTLAFSPPEVTVALDGKVVDRTRPSSGPEAKATADKLGVAPELVSAEFTVDGLGEGEHLLEITAPCHRPRRLRLPPELSKPFADHALEAVKLERSEGRLNLTTRASGGVASLSGRILGPLPLKDLVVCAGAYDLRVDFPAGGFTQTLEIVDGGTLSLEVRPKARLVSLGLTGVGEFAGRDRLVAQLQKLGERLKEVAVLPAPPREEPLTDALARFRLTKAADLVLYLVPSQGRQLELVLTTLTGEEARWPVNPLDQDPLGPALAQLNAVPPRSTPDAGVRLLDVPGLPGPMVLEASEAAQEAGIRPLLPLTRVAGKAVATVAEFRALLAASGPTLDVEQEGKACTLPVRPSPLELPLHEDAFAYPLLLMDLQLRRLNATGDEAGLLAFHHAQALMHFRRFDQALEVLRGARVGLTEGVSQGTLAYYEGLCLLRLGQVFLPDARQAFTRAAASPRATLFGPDGPLVAPLARQILDDIKP